MQATRSDVHNTPLFMQNTPDVYVLSSRLTFDLWVEHTHQRKALDRLSGQTEGLARKPAEVPLRNYCRFSSILCWNGSAIGTVPMTFGPGFRRFQLRPVCAPCPFQPHFAELDLPYSGPGRRRLTHNP